MQSLRARKCFTEHRILLYLLPSWIPEPDNPCQRNNGRRYVVVINSSPIDTHAQPRTAQLKGDNAGASWFDLPAPPAAELPRLHREVEALRLRNHLDPKRFYRKEEGEGKGIKGLPKYFAVSLLALLWPGRCTHPLYQ
jgi:hypothetical protein